jgi:hypothetical protein
MKTVLLFWVIFFMSFCVCKAQPVQQEWVRTYDGPDNLGYSIQAMAMDSSGNIIVTGWTLRQNAIQSYCTIKYSSSGVQQWISVYDGTSDRNVNKPAAIGVDLQGNIYVTGWSGNISVADYCTIKYNSSGVQQWVARYNNQGGGDNEAAALTIDPTGNCIVTGYSYGSNYSATIKYSTNGDSLWVTKQNSFESVSMTNDNQGNSYITGGSATIKYNSSGIQQWIANISGNRITLDNQNYVYTVGMQSGSYRTVKYNNSGVQQWAQIFSGSTSYARPYGIAVDNNYNVYITGYFYNGNAWDDYATIKYNASGNQQWVNIYNGTANSYDEAYSLCLDDSANVYITGKSTESSGNEFSTIKYNTNGIQQWILNYSGGGVEVIVDKNRNIFVTGGSAQSLNSGITIKYSQPIGIKKFVGNFPDHYFLEQNYPNPYNPNTNIKYQLPKQCFVMLDVYDILGRKVANLVNSLQNPGEYSYSFDALKLASGVYIYIINAGDFTATKKMILQK